MTKTRVLVVDDHEGVRRSLCDLVQSSFPGTSCLEAATGEEAVALAASHQPPLVLMDIGLPGISGIEAIRRVRAVSPASHVVVVSIFDTVAHRADAASAGACGYVAKIDLGRDLVPLVKKFLAEGCDHHGKVERNRATHPQPAAGAGEVP